MGGTPRRQGRFATADDDDVRGVPREQFVFFGGNCQSTGSRARNERRIKRPGFGGEVRDGEFFDHFVRGRPSGAFTDNNLQVVKRSLKAQKRSRHFS